MNIEQPSVKDFLKQQGTWNERLAKEQAEYSDAVAKQETVEKELRLARVNFENAQKIMEIYKQQTDNLYALYDKQDKLLGIGGFEWRETGDFRRSLRDRLRLGEGECPRG